MKFRQKNFYGAMDLEDHKELRRLVKSNPRYRRQKKIISDREFNELARKGLPVDGVVRLSDIMSKSKNGRYW